MGIHAAIPLLLLQTVWVVDDNGGPGVDFTDIQPAIDAAADGDVLDVRAGTYTHFTLSGKGLRILGEDSATTVVSSPGTTGFATLITSIPPGSVAFVDRMRFQGWTGEGPRLTVSGATTRAVLADLQVYGSPPCIACGIPWMVINPGGGILVEDSDAHLIRNEVFGKNGSGTQGPGPALRFTGDARGFVGSCQLFGGSGTTPVTTFGLLPQNGSYAVHVQSSGALVPKVWFADSLVFGGTGSPALPITAPSDGSGGSGIIATGSAVRVSGDPTSLVHGGNAGCGLGPPSAGMGGVGILSTSGAVDVHSVPVLGGDVCGGSPAAPTSGPGITLSATPLPVLRVTGNLTTSGNATVSFSGGPSSAPFLIAMALEPGFASGGPFFLGEILIDPVDWFPLFAGGLSPAGEFTITFPLTGIAPSFAYTPVYLQGIALDPSGTFWRVSNSTVATLRP